MTNTVDTAVEILTPICDLHNNGSLQALLIRKSAVSNDYLTHNIMQKEQPTYTKKHVTLRKCSTNSMYEMHIEIRRESRFI